MSNKRIKYIMELVFIFILPLLFVLCNVSIENTFVYDNEGNYQTSERSISYTPIAYTTKTETIYSLEHYTEWNFDTYTGDIYFLKTDFVYNLAIGGYYVDAYYDGSKGSVNVRLSNNSIVIYVDHEDYDYYEESFIYTDNGDYYIISVSDFVFYFDSWQENNGYYLITSSTQYVDSPIIQLKNILADVVQIDSTNATYNVVFDYTCLWFIMFIIWHLVYMFVDFLLHFWRKEEK